VNNESALNRILQPGGITPVYQPVVRVNGGSVETYGVECLSRGPKGTNFECADVLFDYVRLKREESLVDRACISEGLRGARRLPSDLRLGINVHASTLGRDHGFVTFLRKTVDAVKIDIRRLTIEIVEHAPPWDGVSFLSAIDQIRMLGAEIAVDDVGLGQSNFKMLLDVRPHYFKLDRYFVDGCASDVRRRSVICAIRQLAGDSEAELIAEGVENEADATALLGLGVSLMQGFLYSMPLTLEEVQDYLAA
jgi:EAL domain-containing protein (putative c-di-GMP-specific phosphodiesterase class I)